MPEFPAATVPNACQHTLNTRRGEYLIQASWPLSWDADRTSPTDARVPVVYIVDGNAYFFSATEIVRRIFHLDNNDAIVIAIGYPPSNFVFSPRRSADLTPPNTTYAPVLGRDGKPLDAEYGGAKEFLDVIKEDVMPFVSTELFPHVSLGQHALFGHSYGGLFTLFTLFTTPTMFDTFIAASPSIWWNEKRILAFEKHFRSRGRNVGAEKAMTRPQLFVMYGSDEQLPKRYAHESEEDFLKRAGQAAERAMKDNAVDMCRRLRNSDQVRKLWLQEFADEDHGSAALCALSRGVTRFLESCAGP